MNQELRAYQEKHKIDIIANIKEYCYDYCRYNRSFVIVLFYGEDPLKYDAIKETIRTTDHYFKLEENLYLLIFVGTEIREGIVAARKLLPELLYAPNQELYISIAECNKAEIAIVHQLFNILDYSLENNHPNIVVDSSYLDSIF